MIFFNILSGIDRLIFGEVIVDGVNIYFFKEKEFRKFCFDNFGIVFQFFYLVFYLMGFENVFLLMKYFKKVENFKERVKKFLKLVNVEYFFDKLLEYMSGGEMQRIVIVRVLVNRLKYFFVDELMVNFDWENKVRVWKFLKRVNCEEGIIVIVLIYEWEFFEFVDVIIIFKDGEVNVIKDGGCKV